MITVHHLENSRSQRVLWLLEELGVDYEVKRYRAKKEVYFNGGGGADFALTRDLMDQDAWTPEVVRKRTERLAEILAEEWNLLA